MSLDKLVFRFRTDRNTYLWSVVSICALLLVAYVLYGLYSWNYISGWFSIFAVVILLFLALSIPRRLVVDNDHLVIYCLLEIVEIPLEEIVSVRKVSARELRWIFPLFAGCGFFGYYGRFFDFKRFESIRAYITEWRYLVEVVNIYDERFYISCRDRDHLMKFIEGSNNLYKHLRDKSVEEA